MGSLKATWLDLRTLSEKTAKPIVAKPVYKMYAVVNIIMHAQNLFSCVTVISEVSH